VLPILGNGECLNRFFLWLSLVSTQIVQSVYCKFLFSREQLVFCHVQIPDAPERLPAIAHDGRYYSLFKTVQTAAIALNLAIKLGRKGNELTITQAGQQYILWVQEPDAAVVTSKAVSFPNEQLRISRSTFAASSCLIFPDSAPPKFGYLQAPDLNYRMPGFQYQQNYYSLLHREKDSTKVVSVVAELACRGMELALVKLPSSYAVCMLEPNACLA